MNAYDAIQVFKYDLKYYILKEGLTRLCNLMVTKSKLQGARCLNNQRLWCFKAFKKHVPCHNRYENILL